MPFTPRVASAIRDAVLSDWRARYVALGEDLGVEEGTDAYNQADAFALGLEPVEYLAGQAAGRVLIRGQFGDELSLTAEDDGTAREPATAARVHLPVHTAAINSTTAILGARLTSAATSTRPALTWVPIDPDTGETLVNIVANGSGDATLTLECQTAGTEGNVPADTLLTWSTAPTGFGSTATTTTIARQGTAAETDSALQARLIERRRSRPGSGNTADWRQKAIAFAGVDEAFVHACMAPNGTFRLGCVTVVVLGPAAGDSTAPGIFFDAPTSLPRTQSLIKRYLLGEVDAEGEAIPEAQREPFFPAPIHPDNLTVVSPGATTIDVGVTITLASDYLPSFVGSYTVAASPPPTMTTFSTTAPIAATGPSQIVPESFIALNVGAAKRGAFARAKVTSAVGTSVVLAEALPAAPVAGTSVLPTAENWQAVRDAVFAAFDALGSGEVGTLPARHQRFPPESWGRPARLRASQLVARIMAIPGVVDVAVTLPGSVASIAPAELRSLRLGALTILLA